MTYPHLLAFGLHMAIMTDGSFPFPAIGTVHLENSITQHRPIQATERLQVTARPEHLRPHPKGRVFDLVTHVHSGGELVWEETSTFLRMGGLDKLDQPRGATAGGERQPEAATADGARAARAERHVLEAAGRPRPRYAAVSGRPQPDPPLRADRQGVRLPAADRARHVEQGPLPRRARRPAARRGHRRGRVQEADPAAGPVQPSPPRGHADGYDFALSRPKDGAPHLLGKFRPAGRPPDWAVTKPRSARWIVMRRLVIAVLTTALACAVPVLGAGTRASAVPVGAAWQERPATYGVHVTEDVPVTMSDGTVLRVNVYRPANADGTAVERRFPVILTQTPYNKSAPQLGFRNDYLVSHGYVQVVADVRGTGSSQGAWDSFGANEQRDGAELVRWAHSSSRPWSNGDVGLWGVSYAAINQFQTAAQHPAGLKAMFPIVPAGDVYRDVVASGGQIDSGFIPFWLGLVTATGLVPPKYTSVDPASGVGTLLQHAGGAFAFQGPTISDALTGGDKAYDGSFYKLRSPLSVVDEVRVPTFVTGGEYDLFQRGEPMLYERLRANGVPSRLLIGPWTHLQASSGPGLPADGVPSARRAGAAVVRPLPARLGRPDPGHRREAGQLLRDRLRPLAYGVPLAARHRARQGLPSRRHRRTGRTRPAHQRSGDRLGQRRRLPRAGRGTVHPQRVAVDGRSRRRTRLRDRQPAQRPGRNVLRDRSR